MVSFHFIPESHITIFRPGSFEQEAIWRLVFEGKQVLLSPLERKYWRLLFNTSNSCVLSQKTWKFVSFPPTRHVFTKKTPAQTSKEEVKKRTESCRKHNQAFACPLGVFYLCRLPHTHLTNTKNTEMASFHFTWNPKLKDLTLCVLSNKGVHMCSQSSINTSESLDLTA
jgi:hypothetical protein